MSPQPIGYVKLLRNNKAFRRLWYGQIVSRLGDWFDSIALFALLLRLTGSGQAVGMLMVAQFLPSAFVGLFAGVVVDRLPRKLVMILSNLGSAALVLLFLLVPAYGAMGAAVALAIVGAARWLALLAAIRFALKLPLPRLLLTYEDLQFLMRRLR